MIRNNNFSIKLVAIMMNIGLALMLAPLGNASAAKGSVPQTQSAAKPNPVSYTHLDVYKRQLQSRPCGWYETRLLAEGRGPRRIRRH